MIEGQISERSANITKHSRLQVSLMCPKHVVVASVVVVSRGSSTELTKCDVISLSVAASVLFVCM